MALVLPACIVPRGFAPVRAQLGPERVVDALLRGGRVEVDGEPREVRVSEDEHVRVRVRVRELRAEPDEDGEGLGGGEVGVEEDVVDAAEEDEEGCGEGDVGRGRGVEEGGDLVGDRGNGDCGVWSGETLDERVGGSG